jgi:hypothetical protein
LDPDLSRQLKRIEQNIRHFSYKLASQEEYEALTSKVVAWRMTTLEGLAEVLRSPESAQHKADFTRQQTSNLTACLYQHLSDPPPPGVDGSASMIVELAVAIATNMPMESRDVAITYPLPEQPIQPNIMEVEKTGLPALETRAEGDDAADDKESSKDGKKPRTGMLPPYWSRSHPTSDRRAKLIFPLLRRTSCTTTQGPGPGTVCRFRGGRGQRATGVDQGARLDSGLTRLDPCSTLKCMAGNWAAEECK